MKTVFNSNLQLAKMWATQTQYTGKGPSMFFKDQTLYSYGEHFELAKFVEAPNGQQVIFVNDNYYSMTTRKHLNIALSVIPKGFYCFVIPFERYFYGPGMHRNDYFKTDNLPFIINRMKDKVASILKKQSNAKKNTDYFNYAFGQIDQINLICHLFKLPLIEKEAILYYNEAKERVNKINNKTQIDQNAMQINSLYEYFGG
jgi:hypothetical protein